MKQIYETFKSTKRAFYKLYNSSRD